MAAALCPRQSGTSGTGENRKPVGLTFKTGLGNSGSSSFKTKRNGRDR